MFKSFQHSLVAEMKRLTSCGVGATVKGYESLSEKQEEKPWSLELLGDASPGVLLRILTSEPPTFLSTLFRNHPQTFCSAKILAASKP